MSAGKGSKQRPVRGDDYRRNHERIFRRVTECEAERGEVVDGHRCLCAGCWQTVDYREKSLRDGDET
jgi:hypothetical protein